MKFTYFILIFVFFSCTSKKELNEDYQVIGMVSDFNIKLSEDKSIDLPKIWSVLFYYHDTLFQFKVNSELDTSYSYIVSKKFNHSQLKKEIRHYDTINMYETIRYRREYGGLYCGPECYLLIKEKSKYRFNFFYYEAYIDWKKFYWTREKKLTKNQFPKIFHEIYHTMNSYQLNHHFSDHNPFYLLDEVRKEFIIK